MKVRSSLNVNSHARNLKRLNAFQAGQMKRYTMEDIKGKLKLERRTLVAYALMVGCDFTDGIPGVGKVAAVKLLESLKEELDILER